MIPSENPWSDWRPLSGKIIVEIITRAEAEVKTNIPGFEIGKPKFQGVPNRGTIYALADDLKGEGLNIGDDIFFVNEPTPPAIKRAGKKFFVIKIGDVMGVVTSDE